MAHSHISIIVSGRGKTKLAGPAHPGLQAELFDPADSMYKINIPPE